MIRKTVSILGIGAALLAATLANAGEQSNPLHPAYFTGKAMVSESTSGEVSRYVDAANPLHPAYARNGESTQWMAANVGTTNAYLDSRNPLHPRYQR